jgi:hypothetical protein
MLGFIDSTALACVGLPQDEDPQEAVDGHGGGPGHGARGGGGGRQGKTVTGFRGSLEPPGPLPIHLHTMYMEYILSACLPS